MTVPGNVWLQHLKVQCLSKAVELLSNLNSHVFQVSPPALLPDVPQSLECRAYAHVLPHAISRQVQAVIKRPEIDRPRPASLSLLALTEWTITVLN